MNTELDTKVIAERLITLRGNQTQQEVATKIGIATSTLGMYENGKRIPRDNIKLKIAKYYRKSVQSIFFIEKEHEL